MRRQHFSDTHQPSAMTDVSGALNMPLRHVAGGATSSGVLSTSCLQEARRGVGSCNGSALVRVAALLLSGMFLACYGSFQDPTDGGRDAGRDSSLDVDLPEEDGDLDESHSGDADNAADALSDADQVRDAGDADVDDDRCIPNCSGLECGPNGCGGLCGPGCTPNELCRDGLCLSFQLDSSPFTSCAVIDETPYCWGDNREGQVGDGTTTSRALPREVSGLSGVEQIATSGEHTCAVVSGGDLWCWGENDEGQLGGGVGPSVVEPQRFETLLDVRNVQCGTGFTCVVRSGGTVWCWGNGAGGRLGDGTGVDRPEPVQVLSVSDVRGLRARHLRACAWTVDDRVFCWGSGSFSCIDGSGEDFLSPVEIVSLAGAGVRDMALGVDHSCALTEEGEVLCWGRNDCGEIGIGVYTYVEDTPETVLGLGRVVAISSEYAHTCALDEDRRGFCWGEGTRGELLGSEEDCVNVPLEIRSSPTSLASPPAGIAAAPGQNVASCGAGAPTTMGSSASGTLKTDPQRLW